MPCYHCTIKCLQDSCYSNTGLHINMTNEVKCGGFYAPAAFEHLNPCDISSLYYILKTVSKKRIQHIL